MKILIVAPSSSSELSGVQRHAFNTARALLTNPAVTVVHLVVAPWQWPLLRSAGLSPNGRLCVHFAEMHQGSLSRNAWFYYRLPQLATKLAADIVHLAYPVPVRIRSFSCPVIVTLHDLYPYEMPGNFGRLKVFFNRMILQQCLRSVHAIACVSDTTRLLLNKYVSRSTQMKALRIYNCVEPQRRSSEISPSRDCSSDPFLLCVAQHRHNKNIPFLLRAFELLIHDGHSESSMQLVIIGTCGPETRRIQRTIERAGLGQRVRLMAGISDPELQWCYRNCETVVAPSKMEGFGLPVVEALLTGCRVVCSDIPAFREFGGDNCKYVRLDEQSERPFAEAIAATLHEPLRDSVSMPQLSMRSIAAEYVDLYSRLLASARTFHNPMSSASAYPAKAERRSL